MSTGSKLIGLLMAGALCLPGAVRADTDPAHKVHKVIKKQQLPPLPSGTQGPVPQIPLDAIPAVAPQVSYEDGLLTIVAPNSTLGDILRGVRKHTSADIEIPPTANERVVTRLGPGPARVVLSELLNGSRFNYILLGSPQDANALVRVVLVAKAAPETPNAPAAGNAPPSPEVAAADAPDDTPDEAAEEPSDQGTADAEQPAAPDQTGIKTPQQMLQEMQQRQMQMQQQQQGQAQGQAGQVVQPGQMQYPPVPGAPIMPRTPQQEQPPDQE